LYHPHSFFTGERHLESADVARQLIKKRAALDNSLKLELTLN